MSVQVCEGVWRSRCGQRLLITQCEPVDGQQWTDGNIHYSDGGSFYGRYSGESENDLVEYIRPLTDKSQVDQAAEIARLQTDWQSEFTAAQQLRSEGDRLRAEIERLQAELRGYAAESHRQLRTLQASHDSATATLRAEQRGAQAAYLAAIKTFLEALK